MHSNLGGREKEGKNRNIVHEDAAKSLSASVTHVWVLANDHIPRMSRQSRLLISDEGDNVMKAQLCSDLLAFTLRL